jgi:hypothetical protein
MYLELVNVAVTGVEVKCLFVNLGESAASLPKKVCPLCRHLERSPIGISGLAWKAPHFAELVSRRLVPLI